MGMTYDIACHKCKVRLWIGQTNMSSKLGKPWVFTGEKKTVLALGKFLQDHVGHPLEFAVDFTFRGRDDLEEGCQEKGYREIKIP